MILSPTLGSESLYSLLYGSSDKETMPANIIVIFSDEIIPKEKSTCLQYF